MKKVNFEDKVLGEICYNEQLDWCEGKLSIEGEILKFRLIEDENNNIEFVLKRAKTVFADFSKYKSGAENYAVEKLLPLKNDAWLEEDEAEIEPEQFKSLMTLTSVVFEADGGVTFYHDDGDLFWGHTIQIGMNGNDEFNHADIPG